MNGDSGKKVLVAGGNCASNYMIGSSNINPLTAVTSVGAAVGSVAAAVASGGAALPVVGAAGATGAAFGCMNNVYGLPCSVGGMGGGAFTGGEQSEVIVVSHDTNVTPDSVSASIGTPAMEQKSLGSLSGFVQTANASVAAPAEAPILDEINAFLNGGVFME